MSKAERTKQMIIEQAAPIFNGKGIAGTSIDDVLKAAKVAKGCLYGHFESKEELSYATVDYMLEKLKERRDARMAKENTAKGKLYAFMEIHANPIKTLFEGGCPILNFSAETDDTNPLIRQKLHVYLELSTAYFAQIIKEGVKSGEFSDKLDADGFAVKMYAAIEGGVMMCRLAQSTKPMKAIQDSLKQEIELYTLIR